MATGKHSCSIQDDYNYHTRVFYNYDPLSHTWGTLEFEEGPASYTSPEGMWYSTITDMDFCLVHGKSHDHRGVYLIPYDGVIDGKEVVNGYFTGKRVVAKNVTKNETQNIAPGVLKVQAQDYEHIEIIVGNRKYIIDKEKLKEFQQINNFWLNKL